MQRNRDEEQEDGAWFDEVRAAKAVHWFESNLRHSKGEFAGKPFILSGWQKTDIENIWGWRREVDGTRLYRRVFKAIPRKNGKTTEAAGIGLALQVADGEPGAEVYSIAGNKDQARIVFDEALNMVSQSPNLSAGIEPLKTSLYCPKLRSVFRPLAGKSGTQHGLNPHGVIGDEVHAWKGRDQFDTMATALGARRQPLEYYITTAGDDLTSVCWELWDYAIKVRDGVIEDPEFLPIIYAADRDDDWTDPAIWAKANPNLGVSIKLDYIRARCEQAQRIVTQENAFRRLHLNQWTEQATRWLPMRDWNAPECAAPFNEDDLIGRYCVLALDLAWTRDLSALALVFPPCAKDPNWVFILRYFMPGDGIAQRAKSDFVPFDEWARRGLIKATEGNVTDFTIVEDEAREMIAKFTPAKVVFDRMFAGSLVNNLMNDGVECVAVGQGFLSMALPCAEFERAVLAHQVRHGGHEVLRWNAANVVVDQDPMGNMKPNHEKSRQSIDGVQAILTAMTLAIAGAPEETGSIYDDPAALRAAMGM